MKDVNILIDGGADVNKALELFGEMDMYDATLGDFLAEVDNKLKRIEKYREENNMPSYAIEVHSLKSDARYLGFTKLAELAYNHELKSKENDIMYVYDNYESLMTEARRVINVCKRYLGKEIIDDLEKDMTNIVKSEAILIVDDSNLVANFIKKIFNSKYEVITAGDGNEAIKRIQEDLNNKIVACLLDLNMPNVNGFEVLDFFKDNNLFIKIPVSIITGNDDKESVEKAFSYPIVDFLTKPFNERDVKRIIDKTINFNK
jgi:CheY-like chemotaxis protein/HPt (histidine-containing phosphotransfer) domain-containing protein